MTEIVNRDIKIAIKKAAAAVNALDAATRKAGYADDAASDACSYADYHWFFEGTLAEIEAAEYIEHEAVEDVPNVDAQAIRLYRIACKKADRVLAAFANVIRAYEARSLTIPQRLETIKQQADSARRTRERRNQQRVDRRKKSCTRKATAARQQEHNGE